MRDLRDGRPAAYDQHDPPEDGGRDPATPMIGEWPTSAAIKIHEDVSEPGMEPAVAHRPAQRRALRARGRDRRASRTARSCARRPARGCTCRRRSGTRSRRRGLSAARYLVVHTPAPPPRAPRQARPSHRLGSRHAHRPSRHARRALQARGPRLPVSDRARARRRAAADDRLGDLRHRQAHVPRRGRAVPGQRDAARGDVPADPGPRERRDRRGGGGGRRRVRGRRHAARARRPRGARAEPRLRPLRRLPARLPVLPLHQPRQLRQRARRRRRAAPVRRLVAVPLPQAPHRASSACRTRCPTTWRC